jgi:hypothetical protein
VAVAVEASARRGRYWAALGANFSPRKGRYRVGVGDSIVLAHRGREVARGGGGEVEFLDVWMGLRL